LLFCFVFKHPNNFFFFFIREPPFRNDWLCPPGDSRLVLRFLLCLGLTFSPSFPDSGDGSGFLYLFAGVVLSGLAPSLPKLFSSGSYCLGFVCSPLSLPPMWVLFFVRCPSSHFFLGGWCVLTGTRSSIPLAASVPYCPTPPTRTPGPFSPPRFCASPVLITELPLHAPPRPLPPPFFFLGHTGLIILVLPAVWLFAFLT